MSIAIPDTSLPSSRDPTSPDYSFAPEHERLENITRSSITTPSLTPALPEFIARLCGAGSYANRDAFYDTFMRRRALLIPRSFTPVEYEVLSRYTRNLQTSVEWFGFLGIVGGITRGLVTRDFPLGPFWRANLNIRIERQDAVGERMGGGMGGHNAGPEGTSPSASASPTPPPASGPTIETLPKALDPSKPYAENSLPPEQRLSIRTPVKFIQWLATRFGNDPNEMSEEVKNSKIYKKRMEMQKRMMEDVANVKVYEQNLERFWAAYVETLKKHYGDGRRIIADDQMAFLRAMRPFRESLRKPDLSGEESLRIIRTVVQNGYEYSKRPGFGAFGDALRPRGPKPEFGFLDIFKLGSYAFVGKYLAVILGVAMLTSRGRMMEDKDERLQEYVTEREAYTRQRMEQIIQKSPMRRDPRVPTQPTPVRNLPTEPQVEDDTQSLGGLQQESIFWGGNDEQQDTRQRTPEITRHVEQEDEGQKFREEAAARERREARGRGETIDDFSTSQQSDTGMSVWERIRQQTGNRDQSGPRASRGEANDYTISSSDSDKQLAKEQAQKEFDEQLEKERRGESGDGWR